VPAYRVTTTTIALTDSEVVGEDGISPFIRHLGLAATNGVARREEAFVHEMGPPLNLPGVMRADVHATAALNDDERRKVKSFVERHAGEHKARSLGKRHSYCILPHSRPYPSEDEYAYTQFSCAGFVIDAYAFARIDLLDLGSTPPISLADVCQAYPDQTAALQIEKIRNENGLVGPGPWPIALCGYVIHAMNRPPADIRKSQYKPKPSDASFP